MSVDGAGCVNRASSEHSHCGTPVFDTAVAHRRIAHNFERSTFFVEKSKFEFAVAVVVYGVERIVVAARKSQIVKHDSVFAHEEGYIVLRLDGRNVYAAHICRNEVERTFEERVCRHGVRKRASQIGDILRTYKVSVAEHVVFKLETHVHVGLFLSEVRVVLIIARCLYLFDVREQFLRGFRFGVERVALFVGKFFAEVNILLQNDLFAESGCLFQFVVIFYIRAVHRIESE